MNSNTSHVLFFLGYMADDFALKKEGVGGAAVFTLIWNIADPAISQATLDSTEASQAYLDWYAENGGDPVKTLRKQAETNLSESDRSNVLLRSVILTMVDEFNRHSDRTNAILAAITNANNLGSLQAEVALINAIPARTGAQLRTAAINKINTGDADRKSVV